MIQKTTWFQLQPLYQYLRQQSENKKFLKYLEIGATFSLITILLLFAVKPTASAISALIGEVNSKQLYIKNMKDKITNVIQAQGSYAQVQERYSIIDSSFPESQRFYQAASNFSGISKQSSVPINQLSFDLNSNQGSNLGESFGVKLSGSSQYSSILDMIQKITNSRRLVDVQSIQITPNDLKDSSSSGTIDFNISSNLFYLPISDAKK
jgi:hypothetical protein